MADSGKNEALLRDRIWKTAKCRMRAETRYRRYHLAAHFFVSYYSLLLILASLFTAELSPFVPVIEKIIISLSIAVFSGSLVLYGFRLSEIADKHRECYLNLQRLLDSPSQGELSVEYHRVLQHYPNHTTADYNNLLVEKAVFLRQPLTELVDGKPIQPSIATIASYFVRAAFWALSWLVLLGLPFIVAASLFLGERSGS